MSLPETRYARSGDATIAYQVVGDGPLDLVYVPGFLSHVEWNWEHPRYARFLRRLSGFSRLIVLDKRGTGLSDPVRDAVPPDERMEDIGAVMDAAGSDRAALFGAYEGGALSILYAAAHPERVSSLVLYASLAKFTQDEEYALGWSPGAIQLYLSAFEDGWGSGEGAELLAPSLTGDEAYRRWFARLVRMSASPGMASALLRMNTAIDVRASLAEITAPTIAICREGDRLVEAAHSRYLVERIAGARLVELPGADHWPWAGDDDAVACEIEEHLTGARGLPEADRVLTTVLFTDIVGSTERAVAIGDRRWRELLEDHNGVCRRELERFHGRLVTLTGDGVFATFEGPTRAIRCAQSLLESLRTLGLETRIGIHTGECEVIGDTLGGLAVHLGARVAATAAPGEILVTATVRELVAGAEIVFEERGRHALKGVPDERYLFSARSPARNSRRNDSATPGA